MGDKETAENLCRWLEPMAEPADMAGSFWRAAGPRGIKRGDAVTDIEAHKTAIVAALEEVRCSVTDAARGGIIDCTGEVPVVRKVGGTLQYTADGVVAICGESYWYWDIISMYNDPIKYGWVERVLVSHPPNDAEFSWDLDASKGFSTREAAEKARKSL